MNLLKRFLSFTSLYLVNTLFLLFCQKVSAISIPKSLVSMTLDSSRHQPRFLVINCENSPAWNPIGFGEMFKRSFGRDGDIWDTLELAKGEILDIEKSLSYQGVVISGSHFNTRDKDSLPWFNDLCTFIVKASEQGSPRIYGGCFGCQIIAVALGGKVDYNPNNRFILKAECIEPIEPNFTSCFKCCDQDKRPYYRILVSHGDCVHQLPENSVLLASSISCKNELYITGHHRNIIAAQSHPEFEFDYAIKERIWPRVVEQKKRLSDDEVEIAKKSFENYHQDDPLSMNRMISRFLHYEI